MINTQGFIKAHSHNYVNTIFEKNTTIVSDRKTHLDDPVLQWKTIYIYRMRVFEKQFSLATIIYAVNKMR